MSVLSTGFFGKDKKKGYRCSPTFVNLKSNTMKNTHANVRSFFEPTNFSTIKNSLCNAI